MKTLTSPAGTFTYDYPGAGAAIAPNSPWHVKLSLPNGAYITNVYDSSARLTSTALKNSSHTVLNSHAYGYDKGNQRTNQVRTGGDYVDYAYDAIGQLITANGKEVGGTTNRLAEQLAYGYDAAANLTARTNDALVQVFGHNGVNELTSQARSGRLTVAGYTTAPATNVTVNTSNAVRYADNTFASGSHALISGTNTYTIVAQDTNRVDTNVINAYLPFFSSFTYDANGNLRFDGTKAYRYDDENQLMEVLVTNQWRSTFSYDGRMRRRVRKEYTWRSGVWAVTNEVRYMYDGNLTVQERDLYNVAVVTYTHGRDLSGRLEGAGGIGGLLGRTDSGQLAAGYGQSHAYYHADGNGNISMLLNTQAVAIARYLYDPFGNIVSANGALAAPNVYRFSSKELHQNSDLVYFGARYYVPGLQRWLTRDPAGESGGFNLYSFVINDPVGFIDPFGYQRGFNPYREPPPAGGGRPGSGRGGRYQNPNGTPINYLPPREWPQQPRFPQRPPRGCIVMNLTESDPKEDIFFEIVQDGLKNTGDAFGSDGPPPMFTPSPPPYTGPWIGPAPGPLPGTPPPPKHPPDFTPPQYNIIPPVVIIGPKL